MGLFWQRSERVSKLSTDVTELTLRVKALEDTLAALEDKHERLRGKFYATRAPPAGDLQTETKAEILRRFGKI